jgi:RNA polymerase II-associated protein 1
MSPLIGSIVERKPLSSSVRAPEISGTATTGFPPVQHRSKSAFARDRQHTKDTHATGRAPVPAPVSASAKAPAPSDPDDWRQQISVDNARRVEEMAPEERLQAQGEIAARFGAGVGDMLKRVQEARERQGKRHNAMAPQDRTANGPSAKADEVTAYTDLPEGNVDRLYLTVPY